MSLISARLSMSVEIHTYNPNSLLEITNKKHRKETLLHHDIWISSVQMYPWTFLALFQWRWSGYPGGWPSCYMTKNSLLHSHHDLHSLLGEAKESWTASRCSWTAIRRFPAAAPTQDSVLEAVLQIQTYSISICIDRSQSMWGCKFKNPNVHGEVRFACSPINQREAHVLAWNLYDNIIQHIHFDQLDCTYNCQYFWSGWSLSFAICFFQ